MAVILSASIKGEDFLDQLSDCCFLEDFFEELLGTCHRTGYGPKDQVFNSQQ
jgi:hypothetical protein